MPRHHNLEEYLIAYLDGADLRGDPKGVVVPHDRTSNLTRTVLPQANAYAMIRRRTAAAGIATKLGNHSFPGQRDHCLSQKWRHVGKSRCLNTDNAALRSPAR